MCSLRSKWYSHHSKWGLSSTWAGYANHNSLDCWYNLSFSLSLSLSLSLFHSFTLIVIYVYTQHTTTWLCVCVCILSLMNNRYTIVWYWMCVCICRCIYIYIYVCMCICIHTFDYLSIFSSSRFYDQMFARSENLMVISFLYMISMINCENWYRRWSWSSKNMLRSTKICFPHSFLLHNKTTCTYTHTRTSIIPHIQILFFHI